MFSTKGDIPSQMGREKACKRTHFVKVNLHDAIIVVHNCHPVSVWK